MRCSRVQDKLMLFQNSELDGRVSKEIRRHLRSCACCSAVAAEMRELERVAAYAMSSSMAAPAGFESRVMTAIRAETVPHIRFRPELPLAARLRRIAYAALALFLLAGGFALGHWMANRQDPAAFPPPPPPDQCDTKVMKDAPAPQMAPASKPAVFKAPVVDTPAASSCKPGAGKGKPQGIKATRG